MAKHTSVLESRAAPSRARSRRTGVKTKATHLVFAFTAASAFLLVTVVDPYSGATASPYFQIADQAPATDRFNGEDAQTLAVAAGFVNTVTRDGFIAEDIPEPEPEPIPEPEPVIVVESAASAVAAPVYRAPAAAIPDPGSAKAAAYDAIAARGWGEDQYSCLVSLWQKESGWNVAALNKSSGAYGIPQSLPGNKMASAGADWETNPATQIEWGLRYITDRYGSPCGAWAKSQASGWY